MKDPTKHDQPKLMKDFVKASPPTPIERNDYGHVHDNSGIHNYAAYRVMTAKSGGKYVFKARETRRALLHRADAAPVEDVALHRQPPRRGAGGEVALQEQLGGGEGQENQGRGSRVRRGGIK